MREQKWLERQEQERTAVAAAIATPVCFLFFSFVFCLYLLGLCFLFFIFAFCFFFSQVPAQATPATTPLPALQIIAEAGCWRNGLDGSFAGFILFLGEGDERNIHAAAVVDKQSNNNAHASSLLAAVVLTAGNIIIKTRSQITVGVF